MKKTVIFTALAILVLFTASSVLAAGTCPQPRKTKKAPPEFLKMKIPKGASAKLGKQFFQDQKFATSNGAPMACFNCHGPKGRGDGKAGKLLTPKPRNFTCRATMKHVPAGQMFWIIKNGSVIVVDGKEKKTGMVAHAKLSDQQIWSVIKYVRGILMRKAKKKKK